jgi:CRISPR-associated endonuclease/helicase Cas3
LGFLPTLIPDPELRWWVASAVATHHRPLTGRTGRDLRTLYGSALELELRDRFGPIDGTVVAALSSWLRHTAHHVGLPVRPPDDSSEPLTVDRLLRDTGQVFGDLLDRWEEPAPPEVGLTAVLLQGAVTMADHLSSAHGTLSAAQPLDADFPARWHQHLAASGKTARDHQRRAAEVSGHLLLRAPTGGGKTDAVLLWAARQVAELMRDTGGSPRVFYTLPYLSSINAMVDRLTILLDAPDAIGVAHSRAASYHLNTAIAPEDGDDEPADKTISRIDAARKAVSRAAATRLFHETMRVGTPYQLLRAALAGPAYSGILVDAANSVFILDELHAYDPQLLGYLLASARLWEQLGGRIAVLSATLPAVLAMLFHDTLAHPISTIETPNLGQPARHRLRTRSHHLTDPAAITEIRHRLDLGESVLVVANNVAHALDLFTDLAPAVRDQHGPDAAILLHSRFRRRDRARIERAITNRFGTVDPDNQQRRKPGLLVATQVVEVSLDIDFDALFTAAAPLEALLQRFGRINRIAARTAADVIVHAPAWVHRGERGEYADGIYPRGPVDSGWRILQQHSGHIVDEADATDWLNVAYADDWGTQWRADVMAHQQNFEQAFLQFRYPFADRSTLADDFDRMFEGTEAILSQDRDAYMEALDQDARAAGRLLADDYLIPMPHWATPLSRYEHSLGVRVIDGDYDPDHGLTAVRGLPPDTYQTGVVL